MCETSYVKIFESRDLPKLYIIQFYPYHPVNQYVTSIDNNSLGICVNLRLSCKIFILHIVTENGFHCLMCQKVLSDINNTVNSAEPENTTLY